MSSGFLKLRRLWADWPDADQRAWETAIARGSTALAGVGSLGHLSMRSIEVYATHASMARRWAISTGASPATEFVVLWTAAMLDGYFDYMLDRGYSGNTMGAHLIAIAIVVKAVDPNYGTRAILDMINNIERASDAGFGPPPHTKALLDRGLEMMARATGAGFRQRRDLLDYRTGLQISFLALRPYRLDFFTRLEIRDADAPRGHPHPYLILVAGKRWVRFRGLRNVRKRPPVDLVVPNIVQPWLEQYLEDGGVRARLCDLCKYNGRALWVSIRCATSGNCGALGNSGLYKKILEGTFALTATPVNPHQFRHALATTLAQNFTDMDPQSHAILGNSAAITSRVYDRSQDRRAACLKVAGILDGLTGIVDGQPATQIIGSSIS